MKNKLYFLVGFLLTITSINAQIYKEADFRVQFPNGVANQAVDILLGDAINGWLEINISGTYNNENSVGIIRKIIHVGANPNNQIWYQPTSRIVEADGLLVDNIYVGDFVWDASLNQYKITIYHTKSSGNNYGIHLVQHSEQNAAIDRSTLSNIYTNTLTGNNKHQVYYNNNVGIGTPNPKYKLDVNGTIHSKEVKVDMDGWADYVFKKDYDLPTLQEVEKHIQKKGHLPNIPSEKEVVKNGLSVGENQKLLLQKIEELTLYIIELNKTVTIQNEKNIQLERKIEELDKTKNNN